ncbi:MAG: hypothetical protein MK226_00165 [Saprospiraceae bacterium]|nr:hypothetical protein [Saprospiraceae bacterium]
MKPQNIFILLFALFLFACAEDGQSSLTPETSISGQGGSLARFSIVGNYLYTINSDQLNIFDISDASQPFLKNTQFLPSNDVETIFPFSNWLFMGTETGMLIFERQAEGTVQFISRYDHVRSCDPVVTDGEFAYVTLRATGCRNAAEGAVDVVEAISLEELENPQIIGDKELNSPRGLALDNDVLFVCDGPAGFWVFDVSTPGTFETITKVENINVNDIILRNGIAMVIGPNNVYQYDYTKLPTLTKISELELE